MKKRLKSYTIVPDEHYINRDADDQVIQILDDMERPGYVLVSRQMGKTNLLINAKRTLETDSDIFLYFDLSNSFSDSRNCFRAIVDQILELNFEKLSGVNEKIAVSRTTTKNIEPHLEHGVELRIILTAIKGKLVIILDEIDALTRVKFSDEIFAQIRSTYFQRINYSQYERLTYLLSGVVEPKEIIKNPKISPFNIGEKIYLNDFTLDEFKEFIKKSEIPASEEIINRIFYWTNGNPRLSWDITAELESIFNDGQITPADIDQIVKKLYLTSHNKPPIDHIRELVKSDFDLKKSLIELHYDKGEVISTEIKSKLYLAGIINYDQNNIAIKNRIIRESLSLEWLNTLQDDILSKLVTLIRNDQLDTAYEEFESFLNSEDNMLDSDSIAISCLNAAVMFFEEGDFKKCLNLLEKTYFTKEDHAKNYYRTILYKGLTNFKLKKIDSAISFLKEVIDSGRTDDIYIQALLNLGYILLNSNDRKKIFEAKEIFNQVISSKITKLKTDPPIIKSLKFSCLYNLASCYEILEDDNLAIEHYNEAEKYAEVDQLPIIYLGKARLNSDLIDKRKILIKCIDLIINNNLKPVKSGLDRTLYLNIDVFSRLIYQVVFEFRDFDNWDSIKAFIKKYSDDLSIEDIIEESFLHVLFNFTTRNTVEMFSTNVNIALNKNLISINEPSYSILKFGAFSEISTKQPSNLTYWYLKYMSTYKFESVNVDSVDLNIYSYMLSQHQESKDYIGGLTLINEFRPYKRFLSKVDQFDFNLFYSFEMLFYQGTNNTKKLKNVVSEILDIKNLNFQDEFESSTLLGKKGFQTILDQANSFLNNLPIERNEKVKIKTKDNKIVIAKFKNIEQQYKRDEVELVNFVID
ncbi:AAA-like domain-containing protein [uncultured Sphingobacterium sp.]|uniref:AAA-like domain-containing protein n=1 Tax=uncultured Sphingobacterium sp. TaxID=182688 RepID=UPI002600D73C|nr:AAA-like domain-containing protein [uncultured Sphingobacterium sp.]